MTIEVKQLLIKSSVVDDCCDKEQSDDFHEQIEDVKTDILIECRRLITEMLREQQER